MSLEELHRYILQLLHNKHHTSVLHCPVTHMSIEASRMKPESHVLSLPHGKLAKSGCYPKQKTSFFSSSCYKSKGEQLPMNYPVKLQLKSPSEPLSAFVVCVLQATAHKASYTTEKAYLE